ncbi:response regulator [Thalassotalea montiporae]
MKPSILIVDDEQEIVKALTRLLVKRYQVHGFTDPQQALAFFESSPTHIVLSDMKMPEVNGVDLMASIYKLSPKTRRVILTGYADAEMAQAAINQGHVQAYLDKPWDNEVLLATLERLINDLKRENKRAFAVKKLKQKNQYLKDKSEASELISTMMLSSNEHSQQQTERLVSSHNDLINLSANLVASHTQDSSGHANRIAQQAKILAEQAGLPMELGNAIYLAGLFYRIALTEQDANLAGTPLEELKPQALHIWQKLPQLSSDILLDTPMLSASAKIVSSAYFVWGSTHCQLDDAEPFQQDNSLYALAAKVLSLVVFLDLYICGQIDGELHQPVAAFKSLKPVMKKYFNGKLILKAEKLLCQPLPDCQYELPRTIGQLKAGQVLAQDVFDRLEQCLLTQHSVLTEANLETLKLLQEECEQPMLVFVYSTAPKVPKSADDTTSEVDKLAAG